LLEKSLPKIPLISSPLKRSADSSLNVSTCVYHCDCMLTSLVFPITLYHLVLHHPNLFCKLLLRNWLSFGLRRGDVPL